MPTFARRTALATLATLSALLGTATPAQAAFQLTNVGLQCSESLVIQEGDAYVLSCAGDLSVQGLGGQGSFQADTSIRLSATGTLSLSDVVLRAPIIALYGEVGVQVLGSQTGLVGTDVSVTSQGGVLELSGFIDIRGNGNTPVPPDRIGGSDGGSAGGVVSAGGSGGNQYSLLLQEGGQARLLLREGAGDSPLLMPGTIELWQAGILDVFVAEGTLLYLDMSLVPEPSTPAMMAIGLVGMCLVFRRVRTGSGTSTRGQA